MKMIDVINASQPLKKLTEKHFTNFKVVRELARLKKAVDEELTFYINEDAKLRAMYEIENAPNDENVTKYRADLSKLLDMQVCGIEKITVNSLDFSSKDDFPTPEEVLILDMLIQWE